MKLADLTPLESIEYHESRALVTSQVLARLQDFREKGYIKEEVYQELKQDYTKRYEESLAACQACFQQGAEYMGKALQAYALGMEQRFLHELFVYQEITESEYKEILNKIQIQLSRVEEGEAPLSGVSERFTKDWFEQLVDWVRDGLRPRSQQALLMEEYRYYRAQEIILNKVIRRLRGLHERYSGLFGDSAVFEGTMVLYEKLRADALKKRDSAAEKIGSELSFLNESFGRAALHKAEEKALDELLENRMLPRKIGIMLYNAIRGEIA